MEKKKVLIVCYSFPPYPGIGGRRWAKFAKYFAQQNIECHVINATTTGNNTSTWTDDVKSPSIIIHSVPFNFKYWMTFQSTGLLYRIGAKLLRTVLNFTKYSPHFYTSLSRQKLLNKAREVIKKNNIKTLIVSGDPYTYYYASLLKKEFGLRLILDFRDLWNDHSLYSLHHDLTPKQRAFFESCENNAINEADIVVSVYSSVIDKLKKRCRNNTTLFKVIPNGYDPDDYTRINRSGKRSDKIILFFGGNISSAVMPYFVFFLKAFSTLKELNPELWNSFQVQIIASYSQDFEDVVTRLNNDNIILKKGLISKEEYFDKLAEASYGIVSLNEEYRDACFITKTFDYFYMQKPILVTSLEGQVSRFMEDNHIGFGFSSDTGIDIVSFFTRLKEGSETIRYSNEVLDLIDKNYNIKNMANVYISDII